MKWYILEYYLQLHLYLLLDEREMIQKKTFTKWINSHLQKIGAHINDLYHDLQDGRKLTLLLEILSGEKLVNKFHIVPYKTCKISPVKHFISDLSIPLMDLIPRWIFFRLCC